MNKPHKKQLMCMGLFLLVLFLSLTVQHNTNNLQTNLLQNSPFSPLQGPKIDNVTYTPEEPEWDSNITIFATVTDPWGIYEVKINYNADNDAYAGWGANFSMPNVADDLYQYTILNTIWNPPWGPAFGSYVNFTIYAKNGLGQWSRSAYYRFYMNDTVAPVVQISLNNNTWLSHVNLINITAFESGSGLERTNLSVFMGNGTLYRIFTTTVLNKTFTWDVSNLPDYDVSKPTSFFTLNLTSWDKAVPFNKKTLIFQNIRIDNTKPYLAFINSYKNLTTTCMDNRTITNTPISATNFVNNYTATFLDDAIYNSFTNLSKGWLQVAYGFNLTHWNVTSASMVKNLVIKFEAKIGYMSASIRQAGWKIRNWLGNNFTIIDPTVFNSTTDVRDTFLITGIDRSKYINSVFNNRIEIFFFVNTTGPSIQGSVDFIQFNVSYYKSDDFYNRANQNVTLDIIGSDLLSFDRIELFHSNMTFYTWTASGEHFFSFNTSLLPDGEVPLNMTVYDKAGNSNSSAILLNVKFFGPTVTIISPINNSYLGQSKVWDLIVPVQISGNDVLDVFRKMELYIDGQLALVRNGQLGQIFEYDEHGNITYEQKNATWYKEGSYTYYWNASLLAHNSKHELVVRGYDRFLNPSEFQIYVSMASFTTNITLVDIRVNYTTVSGRAVLLEFEIHNYGNSTLKNFKPQVMIPSQWEYVFPDTTDFDFQYLTPGGSLRFMIQLIPNNVQQPMNQSIDLRVSCIIVENLTQTHNNFTLQIRTYVLVDPSGMSDQSLNALYMIISIIAGFGIGILGFFIYQYLKTAATQVSKTLEKPKKEKKSI